MDARRTPAARRRRTRQLIAGAIALEVAVVLGMFWGISVHALPQLLGVVPALVAGWATGWLMARIAGAGSVTTAIALLTVAGVHLVGHAVFVQRHIAANTIAASGPDALPPLLSEPMFDAVMSDYWTAVGWLDAAWLVVGGMAAWTAIGMVESRNS